MLHLTKLTLRAAIAVTLSAAMAAGGVGFAGTAAQADEANIELAMVVHVSEGAGYPITIADVRSHYGGYQADRWEGLAIRLSPYNFPVLYDSNIDIIATARTNSTGEFISLDVPPGCGYRRPVGWIDIVQADAGPVYSGDQSTGGQYTNFVGFHRVTLFLSAAPCATGVIMASSYDYFVPVGSTATTAASDLINAAKVGPPPLPWAYPWPAPWADLFPVSWGFTEQEVWPVLDPGDPNTWYPGGPVIQHRVSLLSSNSAVTTATDPDGYVTALTYRGTYGGASVEYRIDDETGAFPPSTGVITFYSDPAAQPVAADIVRQVPEGETATITLAELRNLGSWAVGGLADLTPVVGDLSPAITQAGDGSVSFTGSASVPEAAGSFRLVGINGFESNPASLRFVTIPADTPITDTPLPEPPWDTLPEPPAFDPLPEPPPADITPPLPAPPWDTPPEPPADITPPLPAPPWDTPPEPPAAETPTPFPVVAG